MFIFINNRQKGRKQQRKTDYYSLFYLFSIAVTTEKNIQILGEDLL